MAHNRPVSHDAGAADRPSDSDPAVRRPQLPVSRFGAAGYRRSEVDAFVDRVVAALGEEPPSVTRAEVADQRFHVVRLRRGYRLREVDDWLDDVRAHLRHRRPDEPATHRGHARHHVRTWWVYAIAAVVVAAIVVFAVTQL
jgi:DivIVA domain-containing protein